ncbi:MAG: hypothetical protein D6795_03810 [Deltaproteobacteria bacterium]|nr:MAG: hypothetical protein D6795_03810 [Deltaproteobacteria bacterium]
MIPLVVEEADRVRLVAQPPDHPGDGGGACGGLPVLRPGIPPLPVSLWGTLLVEGEGDPASIGRPGRIGKPPLR